MIKDSRQGHQDLVNLVEAQEFVEASGNDSLNIVGLSVTEEIS